MLNVKVIARKRLPAIVESEWVELWVGDCTGSVARIAEQVQEEVSIDLYHDEVKSLYMHHT